MHQFRVYGKGAGVVLIEIALAALGIPPLLLLIVGVGLVFWATWPTTGPFLLGWRRKAPVISTIAAAAFGAALFGYVWWSILPRLSAQADPPSVTGTDTSLPLPLQSAPPPEAPKQQPPQEQEPAKAEPREPIVPKNKTNTGDIVTQGPGSIYQKGDNNTAIIGSVAPKLSMTSEQVQAVSAGLKGLSGINVEIVVTPPTPEYQAFGSGLATALQRAGMNVSVSHVGMYIGMGCPNPLGIQFVVGDSRVAAANSIIGALGRAGVISSDLPACNVGNSDTLKIMLRAGS